jgi:bifunctional N-acetylglutamate synthase/kinase
MMEVEIIQRFLESVGQKADVDLYLKLFRAQKKESFAIISADAHIVKNALDPFHFDLRILTGLGLIPVVLLGLDGAREADRQAQRVQEWLVEDSVSARILSSGSTMTDEALGSVRATIADGAIPLLSLEAAKDVNADGRVRMLGALASGLETRKLIFLSRGAGLGPRNQPPLSVVNLGVDYETIVNGTTLSKRQTTLVRQVKTLLEQVPHRLSVAVVNPLQLLRELFTVSGAGTLIRRGSQIATRAGYADVDQQRIRTLFHSAFGKALRTDFFETPVERTYVEENYLGAAIIRPTPVAVYLTKFAVERTAQGEGIGGELWSVMIRDYPSFFWRARPANPINPWYIRQSDGMARFPDWYVFWRGLPIERIEPAIRYALSEPTDLR